ncbi:MAG TPA: four helix bundle protein, partial [Pyrinomonadaceae bacterium]|nr:four helix bundle protein [Pyrinomonadaceae bacterium]
VWRRSHELTLKVYELTKTFPKEELFGLTSQIRRATSSIPANIAEGCGRESNGDFQRFLQIAYGSLNEADYHLLLARDLRYLDEVIYSDLNNHVAEVKRMLASLIRKVRSDR